MKIALIVVYSLVVLMGIVFWVGYDHNHPDVTVHLPVPHPPSYTYRYSVSYHRFLYVRYAGILRAHSRTTPVFWFKLGKTPMRWVACYHKCKSVQFYTDRLRPTANYVLANDPEGILSRIIAAWKGGHFVENAQTRRWLLRTVAKEHHPLPDGGALPWLPLSH